MTSSSWGEGVLKILREMTGGGGEGVGLKMTSLFCCDLGRKFPTIWFQKVGFIIRKLVLL